MSGCAVGADGALLDAEDIVWFHDAHDETPIASTSAVTDSGPPPKQNAFDVLGKKPAAIVAGRRRSNRASRPSARARDPDNTESSRKRSPSSNANTAHPKQRATGKVLRRASSGQLSIKTGTDIDAGATSDADESSAFEDDGDGMAMDSGSDWEDDASSVCDDDEHSYARLKALGDEDREAMKKPVPKNRKTADILSIFTVGERKNPDVMTKS